MFARIALLVAGRRRLERRRRQAFRLAAILPANDYSTDSKIRPEPCHWRGWRDRPRGSLRFTIHLGAARRADVRRVDHHSRGRVRRWREDD